MKPHKNRILFAGHIGNGLEKVIDSQGSKWTNEVSGAPSHPDILYCKYLDYCNVKYLKDNCKDYENCKTYKFYEKYPDWLGVGSKL